MSSTLETGTTQSELSRISGVHQPSIVKSATFRPLAAQTKGSAGRCTSLGEDRSPCRGKPRRRVAGRTPTAPITSSMSRRLLRTWRRPLTRPGTTPQSSPKRSAPSRAPATQRARPPDRHESRRALQSTICRRQPKLRDHHEGRQGSRAQAPLRLRRLRAATASGPHTVRKKFTHRYQPPTTINDVSAGHALAVGESVEGSLATLQQVVAGVGTFVDRQGL
jgi:hypothetical protein